MEVPIKLPSRSYGLKLFVVCTLVLLMGIPAIFISSVSFERSGRADQVTREVSARYGGHQFVTGPVLSVPYFVLRDKEIIRQGDYIIFPEDGLADFSSVTVETKKRSLFRVPVYTANGTLSANFKALDKTKMSKERLFDWDRARILVGIADVRGLKNDIFLKTKTGSKKFEPAFLDNALSDDLAQLELSIHRNFDKRKRLDQMGSTTYLSVSAGNLLKTDKNFEVSADISLGGATHLSVYPFAKSTKMKVASNWTSPGFTGTFPPTKRDISADGFTALWSVPYLARGIPAMGYAENLNLDKPMSVQFVSDLNPYQTVNRSLKYAIMFIGLVFIAFFLFEVLVGRPVHPAQYVLIGIAQSIFYLLLLAFSEHIGFNLGFLVSAGATIALTSIYAGWTFGARIYAFRAGIVFALVYGLLYSLMRMQDFALMIGALASFFAIALVMYLTKSMDWYGARAGLNRSTSELLPKDKASRI